MSLSQAPLGGPTRAIFAQLDQQLDAWNSRYGRQQTPVTAPSPYSPKPAWTQSMAQYAQPKSNMSFPTNTVAAARAAAEHADEIAHLTQVCAALRTDLEAERRRRLDLEERVSRIVAQAEVAERERHSLRTALQAQGETIAALQKALHSEQLDSSDLKRRVDAMERTNPQQLARGLPTAQEIADLVSISLRRGEWGTLQNYPKPALMSDPNALSARVSAAMGAEEWPLERAEWAKRWRSEVSALRDDFRAEVRLSERRVLEQLQHQSPSAFHQPLPGGLVRDEPIENVQLLPHSQEFTYTPALQKKSTPPSPEQIKAAQRELVAAEQMKQTRAAQAELAKKETELAVQQAKSAAEELLLREKEAANRAAADRRAQQQIFAIHMASEEADRQLQAAQKLKPVPAEVQRSPEWNEVDVSLATADLSPPPPPLENAAKKSPRHVKNYESDLSTTSTTGPNQSRVVNAEGVSTNNERPATKSSTPDDPKARSPSRSSTATDWTPVEGSQRTKVPSLPEGGSDAPTSTANALNKDQQLWQKPSPTKSTPGRSDAKSSQSPQSSVMEVASPLSEIPSPSATEERQRQHDPPDMGAPPPPKVGTLLGEDDDTSAGEESENDFDLPGNDQKFVPPAAVPQSSAPKIFGGMRPTDDSSSSSSHSSPRQIYENPVAPVRSSTDPDLIPTVQIANIKERHDLKPAATAVKGSSSEDDDDDDDLIKRRRQLATSYKPSPKTKVGGRKLGILTGGATQQPLPSQTQIRPVIDDGSDSDFS